MERTLTTRPVWPSLFFVLVAVVAGQGVGTWQPALTMQVQMAPVTVAIDGVVEIAYELHVVNATADTVELQRLEVRGETAALVTFDAEAMRPRVGRTDGATAANRLTLPAGAEATIYLELTRPSVADVPRALRHRLVFARQASAGARDDAIEGGAADCTPRRVARARAAAPRRTVGGGSQRGVGAWSSPRVLYRRQSPTDSRPLCDRLDQARCRWPHRRAVMPTS